MEDGGFRLIEFPRANVHRPARALIAVEGVGDRKLILFGVSLSRGYPRFNPGEFSTVDLIVRGDNDAALILGADPGATMPQPGIDHLARIPTIVLDPKVTHTSRLARVHITTAVTGVSAPGTAYRMDEIPLPLRPILTSPYPTDEEVVRRIRQAVATKPAWAPATHVTTPFS